VIFSTTYSGQTTLLVSQTEPYPSLQSTAPDIQSESGTKNSIRIVKPINSNATLSEIYVGVYAHTFSEVNIGVTVNRKGYFGTDEINL